MGLTEKFINTKARGEDTYPQICSGYALLGVSMQPYKPRI